MAKNHMWKKFENQCARDFGGRGRFPANQGGALDFETPFAIGQCKTAKSSAKRLSLTLRDLGDLALDLDEYGRKNPSMLNKWPMLCVKLRRGAGIKSETLFCLSQRAAAEWIGSARALYGIFAGGFRGNDLAALVRAVEQQMLDEPNVIGVRVVGIKKPFVAMARRVFLGKFDFQRMVGKGMLG